MRCPLSLAFLLILSMSYAQKGAAPDSSDIPDSENGWYLSPHGTIRILVIFAEIDYDKNPKDDPQPNGSDNWQKGQLPKWKDDLFDPFPLPVPKAQVSRYYSDISLGQFTVLGDYIDHVVTIHESGQKNFRDLSGMAWQTANESDSLRTAHHLTIADFDLWKDGGKPGLPKVNGPDDPHSYDHIMVIYRNSNILTHGQGSTDAGSAGLLFGYPSDTQSRFGAMNGLPFEILKHEFNHLLLGGNNFHSGGGNAPQFAGYFMEQQGGWSMMGAANSSLLTASAWDRYRLGWRPKASRYSIRAHDLQGREVNGDLDPLAGDTGIFVLDDFIPTGDALRIRMPFLSSDEYPQWLWLENHQTTSRNRCPTDQFHYQYISCVQPAVPGIYALMQVDKEKKIGTNIYGGHADYLRPVLASGNFDKRLRGDTVTYQCLWPAPTQPYLVRDRWANPLTGSQDQEVALFDMDGNGKITRQEGVVPRIEVRNGVEHDEAVFFGHSRHAFTTGGNHRIGMDTNPPSSNMLSLVCGNAAELNHGEKPDNRAVYLNGISVELLEQRADGGITVHVRSGDTRISQDVRWCADSIVLPPLKGLDGNSLTLATKHTITIDRSGTPTRMGLQGGSKGTHWFSPPTQFCISAHARMRLEAKAKLCLKNASTLHVMPGATLELDPKAVITADKGSLLVLHGDAAIVATSKQLKHLVRQGRLERVP